jgi:hypothetical protein
LHKNVIDFISGVKIALLSYSFFPLSVYTFLPIMQFFDVDELKYYSEENEYLSDIGVESKSSMVNNFKLLLILLCISTFHLLYLPLYIYLLKERKGVIGDLAKRIMELLTFTIYIRVILEAILLLSLTSISEIYNFKLTSFEKISSFVTSIFIVILIFVFLWVNYKVWRKSQDVLFDQKRSYFRELLDGTKDTKLGKLFVIIFVLRRFISVLWVVTTQSLNLYIRVVGFFFIQLLFFCYTLSRPLEHKKESLIELIHDFGYLILIGSLMHFNKEKNWSDTIAYIFVGLM